MRFFPDRVSAVCGLIFISGLAANGETARTVAEVLGVHAGTAEGQERPAHARRRVRRTAPGVTARAHIVQAAGIAVAETRSGGRKRKTGPLIWQAGFSFLE